MLFSLEEDFNNVGLTVQPTNQGKMVLCRIEDEKPVTENVSDDYIFVGSISERDIEISQRVLDCVTNFIIENSGSPATIENKSRDWQKMASLYGTEPINLSSMYGTRGHQDVAEVVQNLDQQPTVSDDVEFISKKMDNKPKRRLSKEDTDRKEAETKVVSALADWLNVDGKQKKSEPLDITDISETVDE